jgi:hypothetical protein
VDRPKEAFADKFHSGMLRFGADWTKKESSCLPGLQTEFRDYVLGFPFYRNGRVERYRRSDLRSSADASMLHS